MQKPRNLKEALRGKLSKGELWHLRTSFDSVGNIAVIEVPPELERKEKLIGEALLKINPQFETVCKIFGAHKGEFRIQPIKVIAGKKRKLATYRESGCTFKVDLGKVFFSPRLSHERLRISKQIKKGEVVGAFFAGVGPFPIIFAKNSPLEKAIAIELNPNAFKQLRENIVLNKVQGKVEAVLGDVKKVVPRRFKGAFDRVVMPLPKGGESFLREAIISIKPEGGTIHFYQFVPVEEPYASTIKLIKDEAKKAGRKARIVFKRKVRSYSPATIQIVVDFFVK